MDCHPIFARRTDMFSTSLRRENRWLFPKSPFERTVDYGVARKIPHHCSREAATGALSPGWSRQAEPWVDPPQPSPEGAAGRPPTPIFMAVS